MNKLKTEDVMRALENCSCCEGNCLNDCPLFTDTECYTTLSKNVLYLLHEKDAEIERLKIEIEALEEINDHNRYVCGQYEKALETASAEAIDKFEERLIKYYDALKSGLVSYHIREVAKELKEARNA